MTAEDVQNFEEKLQTSNQNPNIKSSKLEKVKKDVFRKLIAEVSIVTHPKQILVSVVVSRFSSHKTIR